MFNFTPDYFFNLLLSLPGILIAISFHEMAHGYAADSMGDPTPKNAGRLTLNPIKHIDPIGFIAMLIVGFGWAKPVPVNPGNFKDRKKGMIIVSLSGVLTNLILAFFGMMAYKIVMPFGNVILLTILQYIWIYNIMFAVFNILPIPPLDGSQILELYLPPKARMFYYKYQQYGMFLILILAFTNILGLIINPAIYGIASLYDFILSSILGIFGL